MKYYKVQVTLGHLGKGHGLEAWLYIESKNMIEAINRAKRFPGVKHSRLPLKAMEITEEEYLDGLKEQNYKKWMNKIAKKELVDDNTSDLNQ